MCEENFIGIENDELIIRFEYKPSAEKREKLNEMAFEKINNVITPTSEYKDFIGVLVLKPRQKKIKTGLYLINS